MLLGAQPCNSRRSVKPMIPLLGGCFNVRSLFVYCPAIGTRRISAPCRSTGRVVRRSRPPSKVGETGWTRSFGRLCLGEGAPVVYTPCSRISRKIGQRGRKQMSSAAHLTLGGVFPADRGFLAEVDPLAAPKKPCVGTSPHTSAANHRLRGPLWKAAGVSCRRTEFCDFLVCPEFPWKQRLLSGVVGLTRSIGQTPRRAGEDVSPAPAHKPFASALLPLGRPRPSPDG